MPLDVGALDDDKAVFNLIVATARRGDVELLKALARDGMSMNTRNGIGETPLHAVCSEGCLTAVKALLDAGADKNAQSHQPQTPLGLAIIGGHVDIVKTLLGRGADPDQLIDTEFSPLTLAVDSGDVNMVRPLMQHKASQIPQPPSKDLPAIVDAAQKGSVDILRVMHEEFGVSLDFAGVPDITPLDAAIRNHRHAAFEYLLEKGANFRRVDSRGDSLLSIAARENNADAAQELLKRGLSVEGSGKTTMTPLMTAACTDAAKAAKVLLDHNANLDATHEGLTARALAECQGHQQTLAVIDAEARRRHLLAVEKDAAHAHGGVQGEVRVRKPLSFKMRPM